MTQDKKQEIDGAMERKLVKYDYYYNLRDRAVCRDL